MLEKIKSIDRIDATEDGIVYVVEKNSIVAFGKEINSTFDRYIVAPGQDYSGEDASVQAICAATHTADIIAAYKAVQAAQGV